MNTDELARQAAIDPTRSFIVQAPAGSGKTELLIQRFLQLLCHVHQKPEEIIAITFTRKAAAEMRQRILEALAKANSNVMPITPHEQLTWRLASKALERDKTLHWELQKNPNRLRIMTIDALSAHIVRQMPIPAALNSSLNITENPFRYYQEAAETLLLSLSESPTWKSTLEVLLLHLDNQAYLLQKLFV